MTGAGALRGRTALVTGGAGAIGRAVALRFAAEGARVVVADVQESAAIDVAREAAEVSGLDCLGIGLDIADFDAVRASAEQVTANFGVCDAIVVNAGILTLTPALEMTPRQWGAVIDINLSGSFYTATEFARPLVEAGGGGTIVFTSSLFGMRGGKGNAAYSASKFGIIGLAQSLAAELAEFGIRVNSVCPGQIGTAMLDAIFEERASASGSSADAERDLFVERIPLGRLGTPDDVAKAFVYLSGDASDYLTGQSLLIDGGWQVG